jgi:protein tyrosine phosphatase (PTP) superfamily phosphohydrolase (DUF442 family)
MDGGSGIIVTAPLRMALPFAGVMTLTLAAVGGLAWHQSACGEKRVCTVVPRRLVRGAWQSPEALRSIIAREGIKTVVTLTAINADDQKYLPQSKVVAETGVDWIIIPMRGSSATIEQMCQAADLLADASRQPLFFHCVAGHHRTSLAHAAYLIRHEGKSAADAWRVVARLPWARPTAPADQNDRAMIDEFANRHRFFADQSPVTRLTTTQHSPLTTHH